MAIRNLFFDVYPDKISPIDRLIGGVSGENKATELYFIIDDGLLKQLFTDAGEGGKVYYRFEAQGASGSGIITEPVELVKNDDIAIFTLTDNLTQDHGNCSVCLVLTAINQNSETVTVFRSLTAKLYVEGTVRVISQNGESAEDITTLYDATKECFNKAEGIYKSTVECLDECRQIADDMDSLASVAVSGDYNDLINKPQVDTKVSAGSRNLITSNAVSVALATLKKLYENFAYDSNAYVRAYAFYNNADVTSFDFAVFAKGVAEFAFYATNITDITIPTNVTVLTTQCFRNCKKLVSVVLPATMTRIDMNVFQGCTALSNVTVDDGFNCNLNLSSTKLLSRDTVNGIIGAYATNSGKTLTLHSDVFALLTENDLSTSTAKGLNVISG